MVEAVRAVVAWLYCLDWFRIALIVTACSAAFMLAKHYLSRNPWWTAAIVLLLIVNIAAIIDVTIIKRYGETVTELSLVPFHSYREAARTGNVEIYRSNFMNVLLFYPAGLLAASLLPEKWHPVGCVVLVTVTFAALSAVIEYIQYTYTLGKVEVDDVIHNTAGTLLGCLAAIVPKPKSIP